MVDKEIGVTPWKVTHIMAGAFHGGAELFFERLCLAQSHQGLDILPIIRQNCERKERLIKGGLHPIELSFGGLLDTRTRPVLDEVLSKYQPHVVVAWMNRAARFAPRGEWSLVGRLGGYYDLSYYRKCDNLIGITHDLCRWMIAQGWPKNRVHYVPNFVPDWFLVPPERPNYIAKDKPFALALGRLHVNKGFDTLISAMIHVPGLCLVIAGEGPERYRLENLIRKLGLSDRVYLPGWIENTASVMRACSVFVCPSRHEPMGNVVLEGFSAGKPVLAAKTQGPVENIESGVNGLLVPVDDPQSLGIALQGLLDDTRTATRLADSGRETWVKKFSPGPILRRWSQFLSDVSLSG